MKKVLKLLLIVLMLLGISITIINIISIDNIAEKRNGPSRVGSQSGGVDGTLGDDGSCTGRPYDCYL